MSPFARARCQMAALAIGQGCYNDAVQCLRDALRQTTNPRAWSKIMLAIRELSRIAPSDDNVVLFPQRTRK